MEVELALDLVDVNEDEYQELKRIGFRDFAFRKVILPTIFPGLSLFLDYVTPEGDVRHLSVVVTETIIYHLAEGILEAVVESKDTIPINILTATNGWSTKGGV